MDGLNRPLRIEICGGIAAGKTTLAKLLASSFDAHPVLERFRDNPFWAAACARPEVFTIEKDLTFLPMHTGAIKEAMLCHNKIVCDYAVFQDIAYAHLLGDPKHLAAMSSLYAYLYSELPEPALLIHIEVTPAEQLRRIAERGRHEEKDLSGEYIRSLDEHVRGTRTQLMSHTPTIVIDERDGDFAHDAGAMSKVLDKIAAILS